MFRNRLTHHDKGDDPLQEAIVQFQHISMEFPGILANDDVTLDIRRGEIFALVGENRRQEKAP